MNDEIDFNMFMKPYEGLLGVSPAVVPLPGVDTKTVCRVHAPVQIVDMNTAMAKPSVFAAPGTLRVQQLPIRIELIRSTGKAPGFDVLNTVMLKAQRYIPKENSNVPGVIKLNWTGRLVNGKPHNVVVSVCLATYNPDLLLDFESLYSGFKYPSDSPIFEPMNIYEISPQDQPFGKGTLVTEERIRMAAEAKANGKRMIGEAVDIEALTLSVREELTLLSAKGKSNMTDRTVCVAVPVSEVPQIILAAS
jgi:hypothetical protein